MNAIRRLICLSLLVASLSPQMILGDSISDWEAKTRQKPSTQTSPNTTPAKLPESGLTANDVIGYAVIPLRGEFGIEIDERIFQASLEACKRQGVRHIFIPIDSPGGTVKTAKAIAELMDKYGTDFKYHVWVEKQALSASICVIFSADTIHVSNEATIGAATAFSKNDAGVAQVSAKFNSAWAAGIAVIAERKGRSPALVRAMVQEGAEAYAWKDADGRWVIDNTKPPNHPREMITLGNGKTILTLTSLEAQKIGFAKSCTSLDEAVEQVDEKRLLKVTVYPEQLACYYVAECDAARFLGWFDPNTFVNSGDGKPVSSYDDLTSVYPLAVDAVKVFPKLNGLLPPNSTSPLESRALTNLISGQKNTAQAKMRTLELGLSEESPTDARTVDAKEADKKKNARP